MVIKNPVIVESQKKELLESAVLDFEAPQTPKLPLDAIEEEKARLSAAESALYQKMLDKETQALEAKIASMRVQLAEIDSAMNSTGFTKFNAGPGPKTSAAVERVVALPEP